MKNNAKSNLIMLAVAAVILVVVNLVAWGLAEEGSIGNLPLWGAFVVLNVVSVVWAISLLGLHPLGVSLSYVAGGALAFLGTRGTDGVSVAEVMTAGATYGAFGALAMGNLSTKVRFVFFQKKQVPFIFILIGLLVIDAGLNSQVSHAGGRVLLFAVALPFLVAGAGLGFGWSLLNNFFGIENHLTRMTGGEVAEVVSTSRSGAPEKLVIKVPKGAVVAEAPKNVSKKPAKKSAPPKKAKPVKPIVKAPVVPVVAAKAPVIKKKAPVEVKAAPVVAIKEKPKKEFFPLEIDEEKSVPDKSSSSDDAFSISSFFSDGSTDTGPRTGVMVEKPVVSSAVESEKKSGQEADKAPDSKSADETSSEKKNDDWLGDHLSMLDKL